MRRNLKNRPEATTGSTSSIGLTSETASLAAPDRVSIVVAGPEATRSMG